VARFLGGGEGGRGKSCMRQTSSLTVIALQAYDMYKKMEVLRPTASTATEMTKFHSNDYVNFMQNVCTPRFLLAQPTQQASSISHAAHPSHARAQVTPDNYQDPKFAQQLKRFSVGEDCPVFDGLYRYISTFAHAVACSCLTFLVLRYRATEQRAISGVVASDFASCQAVEASGVRSS
jgi:acetoin utilization deacetylase AcuC-like enzyme